ncbi:MAG: GAF domain-containing protein [Chloroflexi bacterium]|nr:GAF domain-containing protein [Chloroflexota bacterium]
MTPVLILGIVNAIQDYYQGLSYRQTASLVAVYVVVYILGALVTFARRLGFPFRAGSLLLLLGIVGLADLLLGGLSSDGLLFIFASIILAAVLFNLRQAVVFQASGFVIIVIVAGLFVLGKLAVEPELQANSANLASWMVRVLVFALLSVAVIYSTTYLVRSLDRSLASVSKQTEHLTSLHEIAFDIISHRERDNLLDTIVSRATSLLEADGGSIYLVDPDGKALTLVGACGEPQKYINTKLKSGEGMAGKILISGQPMVVKDYDHWEGRAASLPYGVWGSTIDVPIFLSERLIGVLGCYTSQGRLRDYDQNDIKTLSDLARQAAIAIDTVNLIEAVKSAEFEAVRSYQIQAIINELLKIGLQNDPLEHQLTRALDVILSTPWLPTLPKGAVFLVDEGSNELTMKVHRNLPAPLQLACAHIKPGVCLCGRAIQSGEIQFSAGIDPRHEIHYDGMEPHGHYNVPILLRRKLLGVLVLYLAEGHIRDEREIEYLGTVANTLARLIESAHFQDEIQHANAELIAAYDTTLEGWSKALDLRDEDTEGHTKRVSETTLILASFMGLPDEELTHIWRGSLLHDIGKMGIPDSILKKRGPLTSDEWAIIYRHPQNAVNLLSSIPFLSRALDIPFSHHEKWDGTGYPRGLKGEQIPLAARIFAVVDVWDALMSERPYKEAWPHGKTQEYIRAQSGKHFDPRVVEAFMSIMAE